MIMNINFNIQQIPEWVYYVAIPIAIAVFVWYLINKNGGGDKDMNNKENNGINSSISIRKIKGNNNKIGIYNYNGISYSTNDILFAYLGLCCEFLNSNIWKDIKAKTIHAKRENHPMLKLYIPVRNASDLYFKIKRGVENINNLHSVIKELANKIWYAICENDVRNATDENEVIVIGAQIKNPLSSCYDSEEPINRAYLLHISEKIASDIYI